MMSPKRNTITIAIDSGMKPMMLNCTLELIQTNKKLPEEFLVIQLFMIYGQTVVVSVVEEIPESPVESTQIYWPGVSTSGAENAHAVALSLQVTVPLLLASISVSMLTMLALVQTLS